MRYERSFFEDLNCLSFLLSDTDKRNDSSKKQVINSYFSYLQLNSSNFNLRYVGRFAPNQFDLLAIKQKIQVSTERKLINLFSKTIQQLSVREEILKKFTFVLDRLQIDNVVFNLHEYRTSKVMETLVFILELYNMNESRPEKSFNVFISQMTNSFSNELQQRQNPSPKFIGCDMVPKFIGELRMSYSNLDLFPKVLYDGNKSCFVIRETSMNKNRSCPYFKPFSFDEVGPFKMGNEPCYRKQKYISERGDKPKEILSWQYLSEIASFDHQNGLKYLLSERHNQINRDKNIQSSFELIFNNFPLEESFQSKMCVSATSVSVPLQILEEINDWTSIFKKLHGKAVEIDSIVKSLVSCSLKNSIWENYVNLNSLISKCLAESTSPFHLLQINKELQDIREYALYFDRLLSSILTIPAICDVHILNYFHLVRQKYEILYSNEDIINLTCRILESTSRISFQYFFENLCLWFITSEIPRSWGSFLSYVDYRPSEDFWTFGWNLVDEHFQSFGLLQRNILGNMIQAKNLTQVLELNLESFPPLLADLDRSIFTDDYSHGFISHWGARLDSCVRNVLAELSEIRQTRGAHLLKVQKTFTKKLSEIHESFKQKVNLIERQKLEKHAKKTALHRYLRTQDVLSVSQESSDNLVVDKNLNAILNQLKTDLQSEYERKSALLNLKNERIVWRQRRFHPSLVEQRIFALKRQCFTELENDINPDSLSFDKLSSNIYSVKSQNAPKLLPNIEASTSTILDDISNVIMKDDNTIMERSLASEKSRSGHPGCKGPSVLSQLLPADKSDLSKNRVETKVTVLSRSVHSLANHEHIDHSTVNPAGMYKSIFELDKDTQKGIIAREDDTQVESIRPLSIMLQNKEPECELETHSLKFTDNLMNLLKEPLPKSFQEIIDRTLMSFCNAVEMVALETIIVKYKIKEHLDVLKEFFFLRNDLFVRGLKEKLFSSNYGNEPKSLMELSQNLRDALDEPLAVWGSLVEDVAERITFCCSKNMNIFDQEKSVLWLDHLFPIFIPGKPIDIFFASSTISIYQQIFSFLLKILYCEDKLNQVIRFKCWEQVKEGKCSRKFHPLLIRLRKQMHSFVNGILYYCFQIAVSEPWKVFEHIIEQREIESCYDFHRLHMTVLQRIQFRLFLHPEQQSEQNTIVRLLTLTQNLCFYFSQHPDISESELLDLENNWNTNFSLLTAALGVKVSDKTNLDNDKNHTFNSQVLSKSDATWINFNVDCFQQLLFLIEFF